MELKCTTCNHDLIFTDKGISCPNCERKRVLEVTRGFFCYRIKKSLNIATSSQYISAQQLNDLMEKGVEVRIS